MRDFKTLAKNVSFLTLAEIIVKMVLFFWTIFLARFLGATIFGQYNFVNSFIVLFSVLPDLGIALVLIREISQKRKRASRYLGNTLILNFFLSLFALLLILTIVSFLNYPLKIKFVLLLAALTLGVTSLRTTVIVLFNALERMDLVAFFSGFNAVFLVGFGFLGLLWEKGILGLFSGILIGTVISGLFAWLVVVRKFVVPKISFDFSLARHLIAEGWPLGLAGFFSLVYTRIDRLILSLLLNYQAVGWYSAASVFPSSAIQLFNVPLMVAAFPMLSRLYKESFKEFKQLIKTLVLVVVFWSLPLIVGIWFFASELIHLFYGPEYQSTGLLLKNLIFIVPFASWSAIFYKVLIVMGRQTVYFWISLVGSIVNILANILLIPVLGINGAVFANVLTHLILFILYAYFTRRYLKA